MASYHFTIKSSKDTKATADRRSDYINREGMYAEGTKAEELLYKTHRNLPEWANNDPHTFWLASEEFEKAAGRTSFREIEFALPNELSLDQQIELVKEFTEKHLSDFIFSYAIHEKAATLAQGIQNPHVHIMICERKLDGIARAPNIFFKRANSKNPVLGGATKDRRWDGSERKGFLRYLREDCAKLQNEYLEKNGFTERVDHRTKELQYLDAVQKGNLDKAELLDAPPEKHLGPKIASKIARDLNSLTSGIADPVERNKVRAQYWKSYEEAKELKVSLLRQSRIVKQKIQTEHVNPKNNRSAAREVHSRQIAENMFWKTKARELNFMRSRLDLEQYRLERAEDDHTKHNPKLPYWRQHHERRVREYETLKIKFQKKELTDADIKEIENIQKGIYKTETNKKLNQFQYSQESILKTMYPGVSITLLKGVSQQQIAEISMELLNLRKKEKMLSRRFRTEMQARAIAEWRASGGLLSSIRRDEKRLMQEKKNYKAALINFEKRPVPDEKDQNDYKQYCQEKENFEKWQKAIADLSASVSARRLGWEMEKNKPEMQKVISALQAKYLARNERIRPMLLGVLEEKSRLYQERSEWRKLTYSLQRPNELGMFLQKGHAQMQRAVRRLREERASGRLGRSVKVFSQDDEDQAMSPEPVQDKERK